MGERNAYSVTSIDSKGGSKFHKHTRNSLPLDNYWFLGIDLFLNGYADQLCP